MKDAVTIACDCSPSSCKACAEQWFAKNNGEKICPQGRHPVTMLVPIHPIRSQIRAFRVRCTNKEKGCPWEGTLEELEARHLPNECPKEVVSCPFNPEECPSKGQLMREDLEPRLPGSPYSLPRQPHQHTCPYAPINCQHCQAWMIRRLMENHLAERPNHPIECPNVCGAVGLIRSTLQKHVDEDCPKTLVSCTVPFCPSGKMERRALPAHMAGPPALTSMPLSNRFRPWSHAWSQWSELLDESPMAIGRGIRVRRQTPLLSPSIIAQPPQRRPHGTLSWALSDGQQASTDGASD